MDDWTAPGAHRVADGIYRIPLPLPTDGLRAVNVYAIESDSGLTLIDGGWAIEASRKRLERSLREIGYRLRDIRRFLVTHAHRDHYTQAAVVRKEFGCHVSVGIGEAEAIRISPDPQSAAEVIARRLERAGADDLADGWRRRERSAVGPDDWTPPDTWLDRDQTIDLRPCRLDALATPGHTRGHYVFADLAGGILFAGDHILPTITPSIGFEAVDASRPLGTFLESLAKIRGLPDLRLLPAHGPVTDSTHARIDELLAHHAERLELCRRSVQAGATTAYEVAATLPWTCRQRRLAELDPFNAALAAMETLAHLDLLTERGSLRRDVSGDGLHRYSLAADSA